MCPARASKLVLLGHHLASEVAFHDTPAQEERPDRVGLLDLPREIRDQVYACALVPHGVVCAGIVSLETRAPHHWHPPATLSNWMKCNMGRSHDSASLDAPDYANSPRGLTPNILAVCRRLHREAARVLYGYNTFIINLDFPIFARARRVEKSHLSAIELAGLVPFNPGYQTLLRTVSFRMSDPYSLLPSDYLGVAMIHVLKAKPGAYLPLQRRPDREQIKDFEVEVSAGWSPAGTPS